MALRNRTALLAFGAVAALGACRDSTVDLGFSPEPGATYEYRYEIEATITRALEGEEPEVSELDTVLLVDQEVVAADGDLARVEVELRRDGGEPTTAVVVLDRAGSLQAIEAVEGLTDEALGASTDSLFGAAPLALPKGRLAAGERWTLGSGERTTTGRLERFGVIDDAKVAVITTRSTDLVRDAIDAGGSTVTLDGSVSARSNTSYDLADGAIRRSVTTSSGDLAVEIAPPAGVDADSVPGTITYEVRVHVLRTA